MLKASQPVYDEVFEKNDWAKELAGKIQAE
jgi:hypothetical protein